MKLCCELLVLTHNRNGLRPKTETHVFVGTRVTDCIRSVFESVRSIKRWFWYWKKKVLRFVLFYRKLVKCSHFMWKLMEIIEAFRPQRLQKFPVQRTKQGQHVINRWELCCFITSRRIYHDDVAVGGESSEQKTVDVCFGIWIPICLKSQLLHAWGRGGFQFHCMDARVNSPSTKIVDCL